MTVENKLRVTSFYKKQCLPVITRNKYHLSKQVAPIKCGLEKRFFSATILLKFVSRFFLQKEKTEYTSVCISFLWTFTRPNKYCSWGNFFLNVDSLMCHSVNLSWKIAVENAGRVLVYFSDEHKNNFRLQFCSSFKTIE